VSAVGRVLRNSHYRLYMGGQTFALSGVWMRSVAVSWLVYRLTQSAFWLGVAGFCIQIPAFLFSPLAGAAADRFERRRILLLTQWIAMGLTLVLAAIAFAPNTPVGAVLVISVLLGVVNAFDITARHSISIDIVPRADLTGAIALNSMLMHGTRVVGPGLAGLLIGEVGEAWCLLACSFGYVATIYSLSVIRVRPTLSDAPREGVWESIAGGVRYVASEPYIVRVLAASTFFSFFSAAFSVLLPVFATEGLRGDASTFAWLMSSAAAGSVVGAIMLGIGKSQTSALKREILLHVAGYGVAIALFSRAPNLWLASTCAFVAGYHTMRIFPLLNNAVQQKVTDRMRGRVLALFTMTFLGAMPLGSLATGWISDWIGARDTLAWTGALTLVTAAALAVAGSRRKEGGARMRAAAVPVDLNLHRFEVEEQAQDARPQDPR
jgi:MFS family permease